MYISRQDVRYSYSLNCVSDDVTVRTTQYNDFESFTLFYSKGSWGVKIFNRYNQCLFHYENDFQAMLLYIQAHSSFKYNYNDKEVCYV